jgi:hypothetical protein
LFFVYIQHSGHVSAFPFSVTDIHLSISKCIYVHIHSLASSQPTKTFSTASCLVIDTHTHDCRGKKHVSSQLNRAKWERRELLCHKKIQTFCLPLRSAQCCCIHESPRHLFSLSVTFHVNNSGVIVQ